MANIDLTKIHVPFIKFFANRHRTNKGPEINFSPTHAWTNTMPKWKQFIKGEDLNQEKYFGNADTSSRKDSSLSGAEIRKEYEAIVNEPSTSVALPHSSSENSESKSLQKTEKLEKLKELKPRPSVSTLFTLCETNNISELSYYFENYSSELLPNANSIVDEYGWTLLMSASCAGSNAVVEYLLEIGADLKKKDKAGLTALELARKRSKLNTCELIRDWIKCKKERKKHRQNSEGNVDNSSVESQSESKTKKFCEACCTEISSESTHNNCIAHLLSTSQGVSDRIHYGLPETNRGFQLMLKTGWNRNKGLGAEGQGQKFPVKTVLKRDRAGFGETSTAKVARVTHFGPFDTSAVENPTRQKTEKVLNKELQETLDKKARIKEANFRRDFYSVD